jgi:hypothetical protein
VHQADFRRHRLDGHLGQRDAVPKTLVARIGVSAHREEPEHLVYQRILGGSGVVDVGPHELDRGSRRESLGDLRIIRLVLAEPDALATHTRIATGAAASRPSSTNVISPSARLCSCSYSDC